MPILIAALVIAAVSATAKTKGDHDDGARDCCAGQGHPA